MNIEPTLEIALAWFKPEEWEDIRRICPDLHDTYEEWLASAQEVIDTIGSRSDERIVKVILTAAELRKWQRATGRKVDGRVRSQLAARGGAQDPQRAPTAGSRAPFWLRRRSLTFVAQFAQFAQAGHGKF
ncbi:MULTISPECIES: hypothetical protein [unclassified Bradyrhizobium]|uniref:hypothetical protein n=1 Tax=unclassified Bradyrhizobium TaxID=2631580 RepID=UPI0028E48790|nr:MULTISPECIES: hypothetical protein [unclassified Bradyrhizobium]